jgi:hypothetical protein
MCIKGLWLCGIWRFRHTNTDFARYHDGTTGNSLSALQAFDRQRRSGLFMVRDSPFRGMVAVNKLDTGRDGR